MSSHSFPTRRSSDLAQLERLTLAHGVHGQLDVGVTAAQLGEIVYRLGLELGNARSVPVWNADAEFKAARDKTASARK